MKIYIKNIQIIPIVTGICLQFITTKNADPHDINSEWLSMHIFTFIGYVMK